MINVRLSNERGHTTIDWLESYHTFSFSEYYDPEYMEFRKLRVINEDRVKPASGFATHAHHDMEIITYILEGELEHKDSTGQLMNINSQGRYSPHSAMKLFNENEGSMGNGSTIKPGEVQRMSAGTGVTHSEFNHSKSKPVHLLQIWILPDQLGLKPSYEQKIFSKNDRLNKLCLVVSESPSKNVVKIHQDVHLYSCLLEKGKKVERAFQKNRFGWIQVAKGNVEINGIKLNEGDGAQIVKEKFITISGNAESEFLLFDLN